MANIKEYTDAIKNAVYGEQVRGSIINALNKVNDDNNSYAAIKTSIEATKTAVDSTVEQFNQTAEDATEAVQAQQASSVQAVNAAADAKITTMNGIVDEAEQVVADFTEELGDIKEYLGYTPDDVVGIQVDFANKTFKRLGGAEGKTKGTDFDVFPMFGGRKRCCVSNDGTILAYYGDDGYSEDGSNGQVMVYQPKFYYRVVPLKLEKNSVSGLGYHIRKANYYVTDKPQTGFKIHPVFIDGNGNEVDYVLLSAFEGSMYDVSTSTYVNDRANTDTTIGEGDLLCSVSGVKPISGLKKALTKTNAEAMAVNRGSGWHLETIKATMANTLLMMIEFGTLNSQTALGNGVTSITDNTSFNCSSLTGSTAALGNASGAASETINEIGGTETTYNVNGKVSVSYRGVENPWGNIWKHIQGINIWGNGTMAGGQPYIADGLSDFDESKHTGNYKAVGFTLPNASGYTNAFGYGKTEYDWLLMPSEIGGTSALPVSDYTYIKPNLNGYRIARLGGDWYSGGGAGASYWYCIYGVGNRGRNIGGRLLYVPTAVIPE